MLNKIISFLVGNYRYKLYHSSRWGFLMRDHIRQQIDFRIQSMKSECYHSGQCVKCGCQTTALQMANKPCEGGCYPPMMSKSVWNFFIKKVKTKGGYHEIGQHAWTIDLMQARFKKEENLCGKTKKNT